MWSSGWASAAIVFCGYQGLKLICRANVRVSTKDASPTSFVGQACEAELCFAFEAFAKSIKGEAPVTGESMCNRQARGEAPVTVESMRNKQARGEAPVTVESSSVVFRLGFVLVVTKNPGSDAGPLSES